MQIQQADQKSDRAVRSEFRRQCGRETNILIFMQSDFTCKRINEVQHKVV